MKKSIVEAYQGMLKEGARSPMSNRLKDFRLLSVFNKVDEDGEDVYYVQDGIVHYGDSDTPMDITYMTINHDNRTFTLFDDDNGTDITLSFDDNLDELKVFKTTTTQIF
jgi:hypothetical protein